jgi:hypothetical protein
VSPAVDSGRSAWRGAGAVLAAALLFNLGQGVLRPTVPLSLQQIFSATQAVGLLMSASILGRLVALWFGAKEGRTYVIVTRRPTRHLATVLKPAKMLRRWCL